MIQFLDTVEQIVNCDSIRPFAGIRHHLAWQVRKMLDQFPVELVLGNSKLQIDRPCGVAALINAMGEYDYNNMQFLRRILTRTRATFVDVGANIGSYTLLASEVREATIVSLEPHPLTFKWLEQNVRLNGRTNIVCMNLALSDQDGEVQLTDGEEPSINRLVDGNQASGPVINVEARRLETICNSLKITPDVVKIDVEGNEPAVLDGFGKYSVLPLAIFVENGERPSISRWMQQAGFIGPFFVHAKSHLLSASKQRRAEDPVYLNKTFVNKIEDVGFSVSS